MSRSKSIIVKIEPSVLKWAVDSSGWTEGELAKRLKISEGIFSKWIKGDISPTLSQVENMAAILKRPLAAFLLAVPPIEKPLPKDYRMLPDKVGKFQKNTILAIRRARRLQKVSKELSENLNITQVSGLKKASISDSPSQFAEKFRNEFSFSEDTQKKLKTPYEIFNHLRDLIEDKGVLVFQTPMPVDDARGFTLVDDTPAVVVVNSKDAIQARIFTLMHEFGHVLLLESGISMAENVLSMINTDKVERWCNDFASSFLLPESVAKRLFTENKEALTESNTLDKLSRMYKLSKAMLIYNMVKFNFINRQAYERILERYKPGTDEKSGKKAGGFAASADKRCLSEKGQRFVSLVLSNVEKGFITHSDALNYLSIKSRNLDKVTKKAKK